MAKSTNYRGIHISVTYTMGDDYYEISQINKGKKWNDKTLFATLKEAKMYIDEHYDELIKNESKKSARKSIKESDYIFQFDEFLSLMKKEDITVKIAKNGYVFFADDETLGNNLLGFINPNTSNQKLHIKVPVSTVATLDEFENTKELVDFIISEYSHYKRKFESKKSARKSIKESSYFDLVKAKEEGYDDYKHRNVGNPYKKGTDLYNAYWFGVERAENESSGKTHTTFSDEEFDSIFGGKMCRKSIKESRESILDKRFYELIDEGYIYDEDENGRNMSYGEYFAVSDDLWETLENELEYYRDFPSAYDAYNEIMDNTSDDAKMFMGISDDDYFYFEINEDENTYSFSGEVPNALEKLFKKFLKETDFERV